MHSVLSCHVARRCVTSCHVAQKSGPSVRDIVSDVAGTEVGRLLLVVPLALRIHAAANTELIKQRRVLIS